MTLAALSISGCGLQNEAVVPTKTTPEKQAVEPVKTPEETTKPAVEDKAPADEVAPYFQTKDITYNAPKKVDTQLVLAPYKSDMQTLNENEVKAYEGTPAKWEDLSAKYEFYDAGTIHKAPYDGWKLLVLDMDCEGPCMSASIFRFAWDSDNKKLVELEKLSSTDYAPTEMSAITNNADKKFEITGLTSPQTILLPDGSNSIELMTKDADFYHLFDKDWNPETPDEWGYVFVEPGKVAFVDPKVGNVYFSTQLIGCLFVKLPDGTLSTYGYDPKLLDAKYYQLINWTDKSQQTSLSDYYSVLQHGCGVGGSCYFVENVKKDDLVEAGKTGKGVVLYSPKNTAQLPADKDGNITGESGDEAQLVLNQSYNYYKQMGQYDTSDKKLPTLTYQEYLAEHPVLYWQDPFGRFSTFIRNDVKPAAECGKPVVYLYPQKTMDVSVKVNNVELTKTIPEYGRGWKVQANPDGEILNYADGLRYPYLFWEGKKDGGIDVTSGTVVAKSEVEKFLRTSLEKMGLNGSESREFMDFWLPRMLAVDQPYIFVSFAGTEEFNKVAPLDIQPKPDTLIRVFMYYMPMNSRVSVPAQKLSSKPRRGFTVVEWGGTSSDGWQTR